MPSLPINHNFFGETGFIIMVPKKSTAPLADVSCTIDGVAAQTRKAYPAPHAQTSLLIENLDPVWYVIHFYRSADGTTLDEEILTVAGNALTGSVYQTTRYEYVVNRGYDNTAPVATGSEVWADPVTDDTGIRDERLLNQVYFVNRRGIGDLLSSEITDRSDVGGGWDFTDPGTTMNDGEVFIVTVINRVDAPPTTGGSDYNEVVILSADIDFDPSLHNAKILIANWAADIGILTIPNLSLLPDCKFKLTTHGGTQSFVGIQFDTGDTIEFRKSDLNVLWIGSGEEMEIIFKDNVPYALYSGDYDKVGQRIWGDSLTELNAVKRDGTQYLQSALPRLMQWIDEYSITTITETLWASSVNVTKPDGTTVAVFPYKGFYARDDGAGKIRVPDDRDKSMRSLLSDSGDTKRVTQGAGSYQHDSVGPYTDVQGAHGTTDTADTYNGGAFKFKTFLQNTAGETRGKNTGMQPLLKI
jgi:signal peptidase I